MRASGYQGLEYDHELKVWPEYFHKLQPGEKTFEVRRDDRGFQKGDVLWLREYDPKQIRGYTGNATYARIDYILTGGQFGIEPGFVVMALTFDDGDTEGLFFGLERSDIEAEANALRVAARIEEMLEADPDDLPIECGAVEAE